MSHHTAPTTQYRQASPPLYSSITFTHLEENSSKVKLHNLTCMDDEPSHVKQLSPNHVCKIGLKHKH